MLDRPSLGNPRYCAGTDHFLSYVVEGDGSIMSNPLVSSDRCNTSIWRDNENWRSRGEFQSIDTAKLKEHPYARRARAVLLGTIVMMAVFFALLVVLGLVIDNIV